MNTFALSTRWNAQRHLGGEALVDEALALGFERLELGYDLRMDLVDGVRARVAEKAVQVDSVHNFCPVPMGMPQGHPELFSFVSPDGRIRDLACRHTARTVAFAAEVGARAVVTHAGHAEMRPLSRKLFLLLEKGKGHTAGYQKRLMKLQDRRRKLSPTLLDRLRVGIETLLPTCEEHGVKLAIENMPTWEGVPTEAELLQLLAEFDSPWLAAWYDLGHGQVRENTGHIRQEPWLEKLHPRLAGFHLHDVAAPAQDHLMPPDGDLPFVHYRRFATPGVLRVLEPSPTLPAEAVKRGLEHLRTCWDQEADHELA